MRHLFFLTVIIFSFSLQFHSFGEFRHDRNLKDTLKLANRGDTDALCYLAEYYYYERRDLKEAFKWGRKCCQRQDFQAGAILGKIAFDWRARWNKATARTFRTCLSGCEKAAKKGIPEACFILSKLYDAGVKKLLDKDPAKALDLLKQAAEADHGKAQYKLAKHYSYAGEDENYQEWLEKSVSNGCKEGILPLAKALLGKEEVTPKESNLAFKLLVDYVKSSEGDYFEVAELLIKKAKSSAYERMARKLYHKAVIHSSSLQACVKLIDRYKNRGELTENLPKALAFCNYFLEHYNGPTKLSAKAKKLKERSSEWAPYHLYKRIDQEQSKLVKMLNQLQLMNAAFYEADFYDLICFEISGNEEVNSPKERIKRCEKLSKSAYLRGKAIFNKGVARNAKLASRAAKFYFLGEAGSKVMETKAYETYRRAAGKDCCDAIFVMGEMHYYSTEKVKQDYKQALHWYSKGVELNDPLCLLAMCRMYFFGNGVEMDKVEALKLYKQSCQRLKELENEHSDNLNNYPGLLVALGEYKPDDYRDAFMYYAKEFDWSE